jgi:hypothetical protein
MNLAVLYKQVEVLKILISHGGKCDGMLLTAVKNGDIEMVKILVE